MLQSTGVTARLLFDPTALPVNPLTEHCVVFVFIFPTAWASTTSTNDLFGFRRRLTPEYSWIMRARNSSNRGTECTSFDTAGGTAQTVTTHTAVLPTSEWMMHAGYWNPSTKQSQAWYVSESIALLASGSFPTLAGTLRDCDTGPAPDFIPGVGQLCLLRSQETNNRAFTGHMALCVVRKGGTLSSPFTAWNDEMQAIWDDFIAGDYWAALDPTYDAALGTVVYVAGHGLITEQAVGLIADGTAVSTSNAVIACNASGALADLWSLASTFGTVDTVQALNFAEPAVDFAGTFTDEGVSIAGVPDPPYIAEEAPHLLAIVDGLTGTTRKRIMTSANSRIFGEGNANGINERSNWAGALGDHLLSSLAGEFGPPWKDNTSQGGSTAAFRFNDDGYAIDSGTVYDTEDFADGGLLPTDPRFIFGSFGSVGNNVGQGSNDVCGRVVHITSGAVWACGFLPWAGTKFTAQTQPLRFGVNLLGYPGGGTYSWVPQRRAVSMAGTQTNLASATTGTSNTEESSRAFTAGVDSWTAGTRTLVLNTILSPLPVEGDACHIKSGTGLGGISTIESVSTGGGNTTIVLERAFFTAPATGSSVFSFGPITIIPILYADAVGTTDAYRCVEVTHTGTGGDLVVIERECEVTAENGIVVGPSGLNSRGYGQQLARMFKRGGHAYFRAVMPDVHVAWIANQGSATAANCDAYLDEIAAVAPSCDLCAAGDPEYNTDFTTWHEDLFTDITPGRVVISVIEHASLGSDRDQLLKAHWGDGTHRSGRGYRAAWAAFFEYAASAALPASSSSSSSSSSLSSSSSSSGSSGSEPDIPAPPAASGIGLGYTRAAARTPFAWTKRA